MISFIGIIGKHDKPLYLKTYETDLFSDVRLIELAYSACDVFQERLDAGFRTTDFYFGRLLALPNIVLYGAMSNTKIKFIVALQETVMIISDHRVKSVLTRIHTEYTRAVLNPFHLARIEDNEPLSSVRMARAIDHIVDSWSPT